MTTLLERTQRGSRREALSLQHLLAVMLQDGTMSFAAAHDLKRIKDPAVLKTKQLIEAKKIKAIAVAGPSRIPALPNLPTVAETLPGFEADTWMGVAAPPGTPKEIVQKLSDAIREAFATPEVKARIAALDVEPRGTTPEEMAAMIRTSSRISMRA